MTSGLVNSTSMIKFYTIKKFVRKRKCKEFLPGYEVDDPEIQVVF